MEQDPKKKDRRRQKKMDSKPDSRKPSVSAEGRQQSAAVENETGKPVVAPPQEEEFPTEIRKEEPKTETKRTVEVEKREHQTTEFTMVDPKEYSIEIEEEEFKFEPPQRDDTLPDLRRLMDSLEDGQTDLEAKDDPPALFTGPTHIPSYTKISELKLQIEKSELDPYLDHFEEGVKDEVVMLGQISLEEVQEEEKRLRDEHIEYLDQEAKRKRDLQEEVLQREEEAKKRLALLTKQKRDDIARREMAKLSRDAIEVPIGSPSKKEDSNSETDIGSLLGIESAKEKDLEDNRKKMIEICRKLVSSGRKPLTIAVVGSKSNGKSSFINTIFSSFSDDRWSRDSSMPAKDTTNFCKVLPTLGLSTLMDTSLHIGDSKANISDQVYYRDDAYDCVIQSVFGHHTGQCNTGTPDSCAEIFNPFKRNKKQSENTTENMARMEKNISLDRFIRIKDYCDQLVNFVIMTKDKQFSEAHKLWIRKLTEDLMNTAYKSICGKCTTTEDNDRLNNMLPRVIIDDKNTVNVSNGAIGVKNQFQKQELVECEMCVDQNNALYWCKNCKMNICSFCKMYHETVKSVMNHEVYPLHMFS